MAEVATARDKWEASVAQIREGTRLYLTNDFASVSGRVCVSCVTVSCNCTTFVYSHQPVAVRYPYTF